MTLTEDHQPSSRKEPDREAVADRISDALAAHQHVNSTMTSAVPRQALALR